MGSLVYIKIIEQIKIAERILMINKQDLEESRSNYEITRRSISEAEWKIHFFTEIKEYIEMKELEMKKMIIDNNKNKYK
jgi:hypothetical protein